MSSRHDRIRELYDAALKRPIGERASFVSSHSEGDDDLRLRVSALLTGQRDTQLPGYESSDAASTLLAAGTSIGHYRIDGPLGAGGMGVVYRATDTKLNRPAAIKVLPENLADPEARRRFQREAQMVSSLNHPHILTVYDAGEYAGRQYLITEYVDGGTLRQWAARPRGWRAIVELLVGVADAVAVAHEAGILHRDIKPENILLAKSGYAKLADFGLAKLLETDPLADDAFAGVRHDANSSLIGTAAYMSPEQAHGLALDGRSDVYSFGLVLHELLSGVRPDAARAIDQRHGGEPKALAQLSGGMPTELRTLVAKALEHDAADRYQTMRELVVDLRRVVRGSGTEAPARRTSYGWIGAAALAALATLTIGGYFVSTVLNPGGARAVVVLPFVNETANDADNAITQGLADGLRDRLMELPGLEVQARASSVSFREQNVPPGTIAKTLGVGRVVNGSVRRNGSTLEVLVEVLDDNGFAVGPSFRYQRSERQFQVMQQEIAADVSALLAPGTPNAVAANAESPTAASETANMLVVSGSLYEHEVKEELTVDDVKLGIAINLYTRATQEDPSSVAAHARLAGALIYNGDIDAAVTPLTRALELGEALEPSSASADLSYAYVSYAFYLLRARGVPAQVDAAFQQAIALNPNNADALGAYGQWLTTHDRSLESDDYFQRAIQHDRQSLSRYVDYAESLAIREDMDVARAVAREIAERFPNARGYSRLARVYETTGELDVGIAWGLRALQLEPNNAETRSQIAELYARIGDFATATEFEREPIIGQLYLRRSWAALIELAEETVIEYPEDTRAKYYLAFAYTTQGDFALAARQLEPLGLETSAGYALGPGTDFVSALAYADTLYALGERDASRRLAQAVAEEATSGIQTGHVKSWWVNANLACAEAALGRDAAARNDVDRARPLYAAALAALDRVRTAQGLVWTPFVADSPCFEPLRDEPGYRALIERLEQRQAELRARVPVTLREYGVADVRP